MLAGSIILRGNIDKVDVSVAVCLPQAVDLLHAQWAVAVIEHFDIPGSLPCKEKEAYKSDVLPQLAKPPQLWRREPPRKAATNLRSKAWPKVLYKELPAPSWGPQRQQAASAGAQPESMPAPTWSTRKTLVGSWTSRGWSVGAR